jgi:hypothetical protein
VVPSLGIALEWIWNRFRTQVPVERVEAVNSPSAPSRMHDPVPTTAKAAGSAKEQAA